MFSASGRRNNFLDSYSACATRDFVHLSDMSITPITSPAHLKTVLDGSTYVVADFYADWCGPCKAIAPIFGHLATAESKAGRMAFVKIDVDSQQSIAKQYGVSA
jgi:thioredoxin 1